MLRAIEGHLGSRQVARVIYGAIIGMALIVVLEAHPPEAGEVIVALVATALAAAMAELYSDVVGTQTRTRRRLDAAQIHQVVVDALAVAFGIAFPAVFFVLAALGAMELDTAFDVAKWSGVGLIGFYGFSGARLAGAPPAVALMEAAGAATIGAILIAFKAIVH